MFAPELAPLSARVLYKLRKGKFVHINDLIRQPARSRDPAVSKQTEKVGSLSISYTAATAQKRQVHSQLEWLEAYLSSVVPVQLETLRLKASSVSELKPLVQQVEASIAYVLHAMTHFKAFTHVPARTVIEYLEAHRANCIATNASVASPDWNMLMKLTQQSLVSASSSASTGPSPSSSSTATAQAKPPAKQQICGLFNQANGCRYGATCKFVHACRVCKSTAHGAHQCPSAPAATGAKKGPAVPPAVAHSHMLGGADASKRP